MRHRLLVVSAFAAAASACGGSARPAPKTIAPASAAPAANADAIRTPPVPADPTSWRFERVAAGVYAWIGPPGVTPIVSGNSVVIVGDDGVVVVDTGQFPSIARRELDELRKLTTLPVRYVITTHWHPDHWLGNGEFLAAFPAAALIATPSTREMARTKAMPYLDPEYAKKTIDVLRPMLADGKVKGGKPMSPIQRAYYTLGLAQMEEYGGELATVKPAPPTATFEDELTLWLGTREVDVRFLGRGNTGGDAIVWVPDAKVLAAGDLLVAPYPYGIGSFIGEWIDTLGKLDALAPAVIVPGHGPVEHDLDYAHTVRDLLRALQAQVKDAFARGKSLDETRKLVTLEPEAARLCGDDPWCRFGFQGNFVTPAVERAYREAKEGPLHDED